MSVLDKFRLDGKLALVTGGAGPLFGSCCTQALAEAGATVITASRSLENNRAYAGKLCKLGFAAHGLSVDLGDGRSIDALHDEIASRFGPVDILVNSALSRPPDMNPIESVTLESLASSAQADLVGLIWTCKRFCADMVERGQGSVINIGSIYGVVGNDPGLYASAGNRPPIVYPFLKGGVTNLTRALAAQYGRSGVRVNAVSPGGFDPQSPPAFQEAYCARCPLGRMMNEEDLQGAVVFLASDASRYVTGVNLMVDGGWTAI
ncbi:MAG: SDR family oxidoreductase [Pirellulales bacterium]|nr:SDR family oxidoreductase [Pirellulales bacterium]